MTPESIKPLAEWAASVIELMGIGLIVFLSIYALSYGAYELVRDFESEKVYHSMRQRLGRGILLGLEFLVAADIIHTVAVDLNFSTVGVLAIVVIIRTFLSFSLEVELTGKWPWQHWSKNETVKNR